MMREHKVGERFTLPSVTLEVVEKLSCEGCYFRYVGWCRRFLDESCESMLRGDKKDVIFREVSPTIENTANSRVAAAVGSVDFAYIIAHMTTKGEFSIKTIGKPENIGKLKECMIKLLEDEK